MRKRKRTHNRDDDNIKIITISDVRGGQVFSKNGVFILFTGLLEQLNKAKNGKKVESQRIRNFLHEVDIITCKPNKSWIICGENNYTFYSWEFGGRRHNKCLYICPSRLSGNGFYYKFKSKQPLIIKRDEIIGCFFDTCYLINYADVLRQSNKKDKIVSLTILNELNHLAHCKNKDIKNKAKEALNYVFNLINLGELKICDDKCLYKINILYPNKRLLDNLILNYVFVHRLKLYTNDLVLRIKARSLGVPVESDNVYQFDEI